MVMATLRKWLTRITLVVLVVAVVLLSVRVLGLSAMAPLQPWHREVLAEMDVTELERSDWANYLAFEQRLYAELHDHVSHYAADASQRYNRYATDSPVYPPHLPRNWNRSYVLAPTAAPQAVAVLLHGLTDSPYSMRALAEHMRSRGVLTVVPRLPGHGTAPGALTQVNWEQWLAVTRLAVREARRQVPTGPLYLVGYSNGGALAVHYALDALHEPSLAMPDHLVLLSPMIGVTRYARFAGFAALPAVLPAFAKSAWLDVVPEFNPFKYNSFPVHAARQTYELTSAVQQAMDQAQARREWRNMPPILALQSLADSTVSTPAVISGLFDRLPDNGSELVLVDLNRTPGVMSLLSGQMAARLEQLLPPLRRHYAVTVITSGREADAPAQALHTPAGSVEASASELAQAYPTQLFSLSHIALPFPCDDALYGSAPREPGSTGIALGVLAPRGERGVLQVGMDSLLRASCNPFFDDWTRHVDAALELDPVPEFGQGTQP